MIKKWLIGLTVIFWMYSLAQTECVMGFEVTIHEGPSTGLALGGDFTFSISENGMVKGTLSREEGVVIYGDLQLGNSLPVTGQVNGQAIHLLFRVDEENAIAGVGVASGDLKQCQSEDILVLGPAVGPQTGDQGDWKARRGRRPKCVRVGGMVICELLP